MRPAPSTLSPAEFEHFNDHGYVAVRAAFAPYDASAMQDEWWSELAEAHGVLRDDRSTWRQIPGDLKRAKTSPIQERIATARVRGVIDDLLGPDNWRPPLDWGRVLTTFPQDGAWDVPTEMWHSDSPYAWHRRALNGLFVLCFIGPVAARGGGTLVLSGSPRLLQRHDARLTPGQRGGRDAAQRELFYRSHPWLMALAGRAPSPTDRVAAFMEAGTRIDGVPVRVVELTGEPGDMVFGHGAILHCGAPNHGAEPRFMRIKTVVTHEGQTFLRGTKPPS